MKKLGLLAATVLLALGATSSTAQACDYDYIMQNIGGTWKVNNAGGQGFGGDWYGTFHGKPEVSVQVVRGGISINGSRPFQFGSSFGPSANRNGGSWCAFELDGQQARIAYASNRWWIFEIGPQDARDRIEMIRR